MNYYQILNVELDATPEQIKAQYRKLAFQYHPDHNKTPEAQTQFIEITKAYDVLIDTELRKQYDTYLTILLLQAASAYHEIKNGATPTPYKRTKNPNTKRKKNELVFSDKTIHRGYIFSIIGMLFSLVIFIDYFLPTYKVNQTVLNFYRPPIGSQKLVTQKFTIPLNEYVNPMYFKTNTALAIHLTPTLRIVKTVELQNNNVAFNPDYGIYSTFIFFPIVILLISLNGIFFEHEPYYIISSGLINAILLVITVLLILI